MRRVKTRAKTAKAITRRYVALGSGLALDHPGLRSRKKPKMDEIHENREQLEFCLLLESKMFRCLLLVLYETRESTEVWRN